MMALMVLLGASLSTSACDFDDPEDYPLVENTHAPGTGLSGPASDSTDVVTGLSGVKSVDDQVKVRENVDAENFIVGLAPR